jgi:hypothetical protein
MALTGRELDLDMPIEEYQALAISQSRADALLPRRMTVLGSELVVDIMLGGFQQF